MGLRRGGMPDSRKRTRKHLFAWFRQSGCTAVVSMLMLVPTVVVATIVVGLLGMVLVHCLLKVGGEGMLGFPSMPLLRSKKRYRHCDENQLASTHDAAIHQFDQRCSAFTGTGSGFRTSDKAHAALG